MLCGRNGAGCRYITVDKIIPFLKELRFTQLQSNVCCDRGKLTVVAHSKDLGGAIVNIVNLTGSRVIWETRIRVCS